MNGTKTPDPNSPTRRKPYTPPRLISYGHVKDIVQTGGGGMGDGANTSKNCWVAEALYGIDDPRTLVLRSWMNAIHAGRRRGWMLIALYRWCGECVARMIRAGFLPRLVLLPLFNVLVEKAFDASARTITNERHCRAV